MAWRWSLLALRARRRPGAKAAVARAAAAVRRALQVCATCHDGREMGNQTSRWLHTRHARAFEGLSRPEAREIARFSGVPVEPQESRLCLGCHATGAEAEDWQKDDTFSIYQGVQCEKCHGPGSDHVDSWSAPDVEQARVALGSPSTTECLKCHKEKPSHTKVLGQRKPFDLNAALRAVAHPTPPESRDTADSSDREPSDSLESTWQPPCPGPCRPLDDSRTPRYKTPINLALSPADRRTLYVTCEASDSVCVVDTSIEPEG